MEESSSWLSWEASFPTPVEVWSCFSAVAMGAACVARVTPSLKELRSIFQPSVLQTPRNENSLCNLNRINPNAPKGSGSLFLGYKHCHPGFKNDRLKVQIGVEVRLLRCRACFPASRAACPCTLLATAAVRRAGLRADPLAQHLHHPWCQGVVRTASGHTRRWAGRWSRRCGMRGPGRVATVITNQIEEAPASTWELPLVPSTLVGIRGILAMEGARGQLLPRPCQRMRAHQVRASSYPGKTWTGPQIAVYTN